jgi:cytochrome c
MSTVESWKVVMKSIVVTVSAAGLVAVGCVASANAAPAPAAFTVCTACHTTSADGADSVGPNLRGVVGRKAGSRPSYAYSAALKASGIVWTPDQLDQWLAGPPKAVPGVRMVQTTASPADRKAIVDYLSTLK